MKAWQLECSECKHKYGVLILADSVTEKGEDDLLDSLVTGMVNADCGVCGSEGEWGFEALVPATMTRMNIDDQLDELEEGGD